MEDIDHPGNIVGTKHLSNERKTQCQNHMIRFIEKDLINSPKTIQELFMILYQPANVKHILQREVNRLLHHLQENEVQIKNIKNKIKSPLSSQKKRKGINRGHFHHSQHNV